MNFLVKKGASLRGEINIPGDKSMSHRAIMLASLSEGRCEISGLLEGEDCLATIEVFRKMGVSISSNSGNYYIEGNGLKGLKKPVEPLDFGNSGTSIRLCAGVLAAQNFATTLAGDGSLSSRPMQRIIEPLTLMSAKISSSEDGTLPLLIQPTDSLQSIEYSLPVASAQVKSCIMFASLYAKGETKIIEKATTRNHTETMFKAFGIPVKISTSDNSRIISLRGIESIKSTNIDICGDFSSASFFILAALISPDSEILIKNIGINETRIGLLHALRYMGANIEILNEEQAFEPKADILVKTSNLKGITLNTALVANMIDEMPAFFIAAALAEGITRVKDAKELRTKESDRLEAMAQALKAFGVKYHLSQDGIEIYGLGSEGIFKSAEINSYGDHRIAMASAIGSLRSDNESRILDCENVKTSFPSFFETCQNLGININQS